MTLTIYNPQLADVSDRISRELGLIGVKSALDISNRKLRNNAFDQLNVNYVPWWFRAPAGRVIYLDDIEGVLNWVQGAGTLTRDGTVDRVHSGGWCLKMLTGAGAGSAASAVKNLEPLDQEDAYICVGFYWSMMAALSTTPRSFEVRLVISDGTNHYMACVRYLDNLAGVQAKWQLMNNIGNWVDIGGAVMIYDATVDKQRYARIVLKWTAAAKTQYYQLRDGLKDYDLALAGTFPEADASYGAYVSFVTTTEAAAATSGFADDIFVVVTKDPTQL